MADYKPSINAKSDEVYASNIDRGMFNQKLPGTAEQIARKCLEAVQKDIAQGGRGSLTTEDIKNLMESARIALRIRDDYTQQSYIRG